MSSNIFFVRTRIMRELAARRAAKTPPVSPLTLPSRGATQ